jgi:hypothetical protein
MQRIRATTTLATTQNAGILCAGTRPSFRSAPMEGHRPLCMGAINFERLPKAAEAAFFLRRLIFHDTILN